MQKTLLVGAVLSALSFTACSNPVSTQYKPFDLLESAVLIEPAVAQGAAVFNQFSRGLTTQAAKTLNIASFLVEDFDGKPFSYINFTTPDKVKDVWKYAEKIQDEKKDTTDGYATSTVITGASTGRSIGLAMTDDLELIKLIGKTVDKVGGRKNVKRLVTLNGLWDVFLEDTSGKYWRVDEKQAAITDAELNDSKKQYKAIRDRNNDPKLKQDLDKEWAKIQGTQDQSNPAPIAPASVKAQSVSSYATADGNLDMAKVASSIDKRGGVRVTDRGLSAKAMDSVTQDCWPFLWWSVCDPAWYGHLNRYEVPGGFLQKGSQYNSAPYSVSGNDVMGCGPAAMISLAHWWNKYANVKWYGKAPIGATPYYKTVGSSYWAGIGGLNGNWGTGDKYDPNSFATLAGAKQASGLPAMTEYLGGFWFINGTLTTPQGFIDGGRNWLASQKANYGVYSGLQLQGYFNVTPGIWGPFGFFGALSATANAFNFAAAIRAETGYNDRAVIAVFPTGRSAGLEAHYSTILRFHIIQGTLATVWVTPEDTFVGGSNWEVNLGNVNNIASGVFYFTN
jgi:hypothetical protein